MSDFGAEWKGIKVGEALRRSARTFQDELFLIDDDCRLSFGDVDAAVDKLACGLLTMGVRRGDNVACWLTNSAEWVVLWLACCRIGACVVSVNTRYKVSEVEFILRQSNAKALVSVERY